MFAPFWPGVTGGEFSGLSGVAKRARSDNRIRYEEANSGGILSLRFPDHRHMRVTEGTGTTPHECTADAIAGYP